jgi:hypothetical protein
VHGISIPVDGDAEHFNLSMADLQSILEGTIKIWLYVVSAYGAFSPQGTADIDHQTS